MSITWNAKYLLRIQQQTKIKPLLLIHNKIKICKIDRPFVMKICPFFYNSPLCGDKVRCLTHRQKNKPHKNSLGDGNSNTISGLGDNIKKLNSPSAKCGENGFFEVGSV